LEIMAQSLRAGGRAAAGTECACAILIFYTVIGKGLP
jgi:hypothetical protein